MTATCTKYFQGFSSLLSSTGMRLKTDWLRLTGLSGASVLAGCLVPDVPEDIYFGDTSTIVEGDAGEQPLDADSEPPAETPVPDDADADAGSDESAGPAAPPNAACDFSGRWLLTERAVAAGLGVRQAGIWWYYFELAQNGDKLTTQKGLVCGSEVKPIDAVSAAVKMDTSFDQILAQNPLDGLTGSVSGGSNGCSFKLARFYVLVGATAEHYRDPSNALPTIEQEASGSTPGWEDWDKDGMPGSTLHVSGIANGTRSEVIRAWAEINGRVSSKGSMFTVPLDWNQEESVFGASSDILKATGGKVTDKNLHFAQLAKLSDSQGTGSDKEICAQMRSLAPKLTPEANQ